MQELETALAEMRNNRDALQKKLKEEQERKLKLEVRLLLLLLLLILRQLLIPKYRQPAHIRTEKLYNTPYCRLYSYIHCTVH